MENSLPESWKEVELGDICHTTSGGTPSRSILKYYQGNIPWVKSGELEHNVILDTQEKISAEAIANSSAKIFPKGTLLIALYGATVGKLAFLGIDAATNQAVCGIFKSEIVDLKFLFHFLHFKRPDLINQSFGGAQPNISQTILKKVEIPLAPLPEQHRIVAKMDELIEKTERSKKRLEKIPLILKRFRQSVLAAAVSGKLTEEWREKNKVEEFQSNDELGNICEVISGNAFKSSEFIGEGIPVVKIANVQYGIYEIDSTQQFLPESFLKKYPKFIVKGEDVLLALTRPITNDTLKVCLYPTKNSEALLNQRVALLKPKSSIVKEYLLLLFQSHIFKEEIKNNLSETLQPNLSPKDLEKIKINFPSKEEQHEIVRRVEALFAFADKIETRYTKAKAQFDKLPQALLAKAFKGELVEQDAGDESASVLLERIKKEKTTSSRLGSGHSSLKKGGDKKKEKQTV